MLTPLHGQLRNKFTIDSAYFHFRTFPSSYFLTQLSFFFFSFFFKLNKFSFLKKKKENNFTSVVYYYIINSSPIYSPYLTKILSSLSDTNNKCIHTQLTTYLTFTLQSHESRNHTRYRIFPNPIVPTSHLVFASPHCLFCHGGNVQSIQTYKLPTA